MGDLFDRFNVDPIIGKEITIGNRFSEVLISEKDKIFCYIRPSSTNDECQNKYGFYRVSQGCIILDNYVNSKLNSKQYFKKIFAGIRLPHPDCYYAVFVDGEEEKDITRAIFGLTYEELTVLLDAYAKAMGTYRDFYTYPKLTRSITNDNFCDLTELWIPKQFPYITFSENGCDFSHVSLWGLYRHIQLLTGRKICSIFSQTLLNFGATEEILNTLFNIGNMICYQTLVTKTVMNNNP